MSPRSRPQDVVERLATTFDERDRDLVGGDPLAFEGYARQLEDARERSGGRESARWGVAEVDGEPCILVVCDFAFLGGSMGLAHGEKVARAFDAGCAERLPVVTVTASGGARMQEGMVSLVQMAKTAEARSLHRCAGLGHVAVLDHPTTGGVYASYASLADVVLASPDALVGFAGPRVVAELTGAQAPEEVHRSEFAAEHGFVDAIVPPEEQRSVVGRVLRGLTPALGTAPRGERTQPPPSDRSNWERLRLARHPERPTGRTILDAILDDAFELSGDRVGGADDRAVVVRLGAVNGTRVVAIAHDVSGDGRIRPAGFRKAVRALDLAGRLGLPVVSIVDTRGADPLPPSEAGGVAPAIAQTFAATLSCPTPVLVVVTGEGGSGGALATAVGDRLLVTENAVFSVIAPEGAASILYRDGSRAPELAERLRIGAHDLVALGIADRVVREPDGGMHVDPASATALLRDEVAAELAELVERDARDRRERRSARWRNAGNRWITQGS